MKSQALDILSTNPSMMIIIYITIHVYYILYKYREYQR